MTLLPFWIVPIALVVWGVASLRRGQHPSTQDETPLPILQRCCARGEIS